MAFRRKLSIVISGSRKAKNYFLGVGVGVGVVLGGVGGTKTYILGKSRLLTKHKLFKPNKTLNRHQLLIF